MVVDVLAWVAIGLGASLAAMIWTFRRGSAGVLTNAAVGITGALSGALLSLRSLPPLARREAYSLWFAALGAIVALVVAHVAWLLWARHKQATE